MLSLPAEAPVMVIDSELWLRADVYASGSDAPENVTSDAVTDTESVLELGGRKMQLTAIGVAYVSSTKSVMRLLGDVVIWFFVTVIVVAVAGTAYASARELMAYASASPPDGVAVRPIMVYVFAVAPLPELGHENVPLERKRTYGVEALQLSVRSSWPVVGWRTASSVMADASCCPTARVRAVAASVVMTVRDTVMAIAAVGAR